jgi:hypothetical protein
MLCRITDDPSYDYSDYCEGRGYYAERHEITEREDDPNYDPDNPWGDAHLYPPISPEEAQERIAEVKARMEAAARMEEGLRKLFGGKK